MPSMEIVQANPGHLDEVARLFDLYRQFYECEPDLTLARSFIGARMENNESTIFVALEGDRGVGFVQLYDSFCSVEAIRICILYDLFVDQGARKGGVGEALMERAKQYALDIGAGRIDLLTAHTNLAGQRLYEKLGYRLTNEDFHAYSLYPNP